MSDISQNDNICSLSNPIKVREFLAKIEISKNPTTPLFDHIVAMLVPENYRCSVHEYARIALIDFELFTLS